MHNYNENFWTTIFKEINIYVVPIKYIDAVIFSFNNKKIWEIEISKEVKKEGFSSLEKIISDFISEYDDNINDVNFKINMLSVKKDITKSIKKFCNKLS